MEEKTDAMKHEKGIVGQEIEQLREALAATLRELEDRTWTNLTQSDHADLPGLSESDRPALRAKAKEFAAKNPMVKHSVNLNAWFTFGQGVGTPKIKHEDKNLEMRAQELINQIWRDDDNRATLTSYIAQERLSRKRDIEGDLFLMLFVDEASGLTKIRIPDANEITDIIFDPDDRNRPLYYKREVCQAAFSFKANRRLSRIMKKVDYIRDVRFDEWEAALTEEERNAKSEYLNRATSDAYMYHQTINADINDKFGISETYASLDWVRAHRDTARDMATLVRALAALAWRKKIKGTAAQVSAAAAALQPQAASMGALGNPPPIAGSTVIENEAVSWDAIKVDTGGVQNATAGMRELALMVAVGYDLMEHYYGNGDNANLATATAMELPVLKKYEAAQSWWENVFVDVIRFILRKAAPALGYDPGDVWRFTIDVDFPPIITKDIKQFVEAINVAVSAGTLSRRQAAQLTMTAFAMDNIDQEITELFPEKEPGLQSNLEESLRALRDALREAQNPKG